MNANTAFFYLIFEMTVKERDFSRMSENDAPSRANASFADAREAQGMEARVRLRPF